MTGDSNTPGWTKKTARKLALTTALSMPLPEAGGAPPAAPDQAQAAASTLAQGDHYPENAMGTVGVGTLAAGILAARRHRNKEEPQR